jgi:hypothetical protein
MELNRKDIPIQFLTTLPDGIKLVKRHGKEFLVVDLVTDKQGNSLMNETVKIHGEPSIKLHIKIGKSEGVIFVDAYWGSHAKLYSFIPDVSDGFAFVEASSPISGKTLMTAWECDQKGCGSTEGIELDLPGKKNKIYVCARLGCPGHEMAVRELSREVSHSISTINFFGEGEDELFHGI